MAFSLQRKIAIIALALYWPTLFVSTHIPMPQVVRQADVSDKSLHFLGYCVLVFLLWFAVHGDEKVNWRTIAPLWILALVAMYGVLDEWSQNFVAGRTCDIHDFLADVSGTVAGLILFSVLTFWSAGLFITALVIFSMVNVTRADLARLMPVTSTVFHLFAYAVFTVQWVQYMRRFLSAVHARRAGVTWLAAALAGPTALLLIVKLFAVICGRAFAVRDMLICAGAIGAVVAVTYLIRVGQRTNEQGCQVEGIE
jgi:VanZ family protein